MNVRSSALPLNVAWYVSRLRIRPPAGEQDRIIDELSSFTGMCSQFENVLLERDDLKKRVAESLANEVAG